MTRPKASGSITRPVLIADLPCTICRYWVVRKISPKRAKKAEEIASEPSAKAGDFFYVPPGHDSWVVGNEPYASLHILGSEGYATPAA
jgi:hypothetical protein